MHQRNAQQTRLALMQAGARLFAELGFDGASTQRIAEAANVNKAMVQYHFVGKLGLYQAIFNHVLDRSESRLETFSPERAADGPTAIGEWIELLCELAGLMPSLPGLLMREHLEQGKRLSESAQSRLNLFQDKTEQVLGAHSEFFRSEDPRHVHLSIVGAVNYFLVTEEFRRRFEQHQQLAGGADDQTTYRAYLKRLFASGLAACTPQ